MESALKNSITGRMKEAENNYPRCPPAKLKTVAQAEYVSVEAYIRTLDVGVGQVPEAVTKIDGRSIVKDRKSVV